MRKPGLRGQFWPSADDELLLRAVLWPGERAVEAWTVLRHRFDIDRVGAEQLRLLPLLWRNLTRLGVDDPLLPRLKGLYRHAWFANQLLLRSTVPALRALQEAGIETIVLKGAALIGRYYPDAGLRPMADLDLLVRASRAQDAFRVLEAEGWTMRSPELLPMPAWFDLIRVSLVDRDGSNVDLHWRLWEKFACPDGEPEDEGFWSDAVPVVVGDVEALALGPADQLLHVILHGTRWDSGAPLRWIADAMTILSVEGSEIDWELLVDRATWARRSLAVRDALDYLVRALDAPIPPGVVDELARVPTTARDALAHRLAGWRGPALLGDLPRTLEHYLELSRTWTVGQTITRVPVFLQRGWGLESPWQAPGYALRKAAAKVRARAARPDAGGEHGPGTSPLRPRESPRSRRSA